MIFKLIPTTDKSKRDLAANRDFCFKISFIERYQILERWVKFKMHPDGFATVDFLKEEIMCAYRIKARGSSSDSLVGDNLGKKGDVRRIVKEGSYILEPL